MRLATVIVFVFGIPAVCAAADKDAALQAFAKAGCAGCHNPDGVASATRLKFASAEHADALPEVAPALIDRSDPAKSLLVQKPTRRVAHAGGKRIEPGSAEESALVAWIATLPASGAASAHGTSATTLRPVGPVMRRLTHAQYNNTLRDLLGDDSRVADSFPPEDFVNGFRNQYQSQSVSPIQAEAYAAAAEKVTRKAFAGDTTKILPCKESAPGCSDRFIRDFGRRAFRRPLTAAETARYKKLFGAGGARMVMEAMLQSPNFLLRTENGLDRTARPYEVASELSYFLWNTMPDQELMRAAAAGELNTPAGLERAARRLVADPRAREAMNDFLAEWLRFDRLTGTVRDRRMFPQFSPELVVSMLSETRRLFEEAAWGKDRNFMDFYSADYGFISADLASLYGVPTGSGKVTFPASTERAGVLGQATFLALTSKPAETSPTSRGLFVREQFLCQEVPQPPPGVNANLPALTKEQPQTNRQRLAVHLNNESCASCHTLIDPIGFGFERFDAIGQRRDKQKLVIRDISHGARNAPPVTVELELDTTGHVAGIQNSGFSSPRELGRILAGAAQCQECVVKQVFRWAAGRHETAADRVVIRKVYEEFKASGFRFPELLVSMARELAFAGSGS